MALSVKSTAFAEGNPIPKKHSCQGSDVSPALSWEGIPAEAKSIALIVDDPDAPGGTWVHWLAYNIPATLRGLPEAVPDQRVLDNGIRQGKNDFGKIGYGGPCPPPGPVHRYYFKVYALNSVLEVEAGATKAQLETVMKSRILAEGRLMGTYRR